MCTSRYCLVGINLIFLVLALVLLIVGSSLEYSVQRDYGLFSTYLNPPVSLVIAFGALLLIASSISLFAAYYEDRCVLSCYNIIVFVLVVVELSVGIAGFVVKSNMLTFMEGAMRKAQVEYTSDLSANTTWDALQHDLKCCGVDFYEEWYHYLGNATVPDSCCAVYTVSCGNNAVENGNVFNAGCIAAIYEWAEHHEVPVAILFPFIIIFQLCSVLCSRRYDINIQQYHAIYY